MKALHILALSCAITLPLAAQSATSVSVSIGQPGFFGRIDIGGAPPPEVIYTEPVVIERVRVQREPLYLRVPPGHERDWAKHCRHYNACGRPVYFVRDDWYRDVYAPHYREHHGHGHGPDRDDRHDHDHDDHGPGRGHGHGRGH